MDRINNENKVWIDRINKENKVWIDRIIVNFKLRLIFYIKLQCYYNYNNIKFGFGFYVDLIRYDIIL